MINLLHPHTWQQMRRHEQKHTSRLLPIIVFILTATSLMLTSCDEERDNFLLPDGHYVLSNYQSDDSPVTFDFRGDRLVVEHADRNIQPFGSGTSSWVYEITLPDSVLHISTTYYDYDDDYSTEDYYLGISITPDCDMITLTYERRWLNKRYEYLLIRR